MAVIGNRVSWAHFFDEESFNLHKYFLKYWICSKTKELADGFHKAPTADKRDNHS